MRQTLLPDHLGQRPWLVRKMRGRSRKLVLSELLTQIMREGRATKTGTRKAGTNCGPGEKACQKTGKTTQKKAAVKGRAEECANQQKISYSDGGG